MNTRAQELERTISEEAAKLKQAEAELAGIHRSCQHNWGQVVYCPEHIPAYDIPGDPPGTMGVDWRPGCHVNAQTINKWSRTCQLCGLTKKTTETEQHVSHAPIFS